MKTVFVVMCAEFIHPGHINILKHARDLGEVTVGLATDEYNARYKRLAIMDYEQRKVIVENISGVKRVIPQGSLDLAPNLRRLKPDYFVHGDDWQAGPRSDVRRQVIELLREWGGTLIEPPYTPGISSTRLHTAWRPSGATPEFRRRQFHRLLKFQPLVRILRVSHPIACVIAEQAQVTANGKISEFDALLFGSPPGRTEWLQETALIQNAFPSEQTLTEHLRLTTRPLLFDPVPVSGHPLEMEALMKNLDLGGVTGIILDAVASPGAAPSASWMTAIRTGHNLNQMAVLTRLKPPASQAEVEASVEIALAYRGAGADAILVRVDPGRITDLLLFCSALHAADPSLPLIAELTENQPVLARKLASAGVRGIVFSSKPLEASADRILQSAVNLLRESLTYNPGPEAAEP